MYFDNFPTIPYDSAGTGELKTVTNLLRRVAIRNKARTDRLLFDTYDVKNGEKPEDIAFKFYGDAELHWIVLMVNNITDRFYQWPMTQPDFEEFLADKYGAGSEDSIHHYELAQTSGKTTSIDDSHMLEVNSDTSGATTITNREYEEREQNRIRDIRLLDQKYLDQFVEEFFSLIKRESY